MEYTITITGRGGHGSRPDNAINPINCFAAIHTALRAQGYAPIRVDGGTSGNIIPNTVTFICMFPGSREILEQVVHHTCSAFRCAANIQENESTV